MILDGDYNTSELEEITGLLIKHLKRCEVPTNKQGIAAEEFVGKICTWVESTTTLPSGIHLGHYHALITRHCHKDSPKAPECELLDAHQEALIYAHVLLINYALCMGISYDRCKMVVNIMLEKDPGEPKIHRLHVIHIYEADYNLLLSIQWRNLMQLTEDNQLLNEGQYGARPDRNAHDPVFIEEMQYEICQASRTPLVKVDNDATSCYDRILRNMASIACQKFGLHKNMAFVWANTLEEAKYKLCTMLGMSEESYFHYIAFLIYGTGQGSGNSPVVWCFLRFGLGRGNSHSLREDWWCIELSRY